MRSEPVDAGTAGIAGGGGLWPTEPPACRDHPPATWGACGRADSCCVVTSCHPTPLPHSGEGSRLCPPPR